MEFAKVEIKEGYAVITITRPEALNALNDEVFRDLLLAFKEVEKDDSVRAVILTGENKSFVAGGDIKYMSTIDFETAHDFFEHGHYLMKYIENFKRPVMAAINGYAFGGGCELAMSCDFRIASDRALFGMPETGLGIIPGWGGTQRLPKLVGMGMAKYLILSGAKIGAEEAMRIGLVERVFPHEQLMAECEKIAMEIASHGPIANTAAKRVINNGFMLDTKTALALETEASTMPFASEDKVEGMDAFLNKRKPNFTNK